MDTLINDIAFNDLSHEIISIRYKHGKLLPENELKRIKEISEVNLLKKESNALSVFAKGLYTSIKSIYYDVTEQSGLTYSEILNAYNILKQHPFMIRKNPDHFLSKGFNVAIVLERQNRYNELHHILNEISCIEKDYNLKLNSVQKGTMLEITLRARLAYYINTFQFTEGVSFLETAVQQMEAQKKNISQEAMVSFYFTAASLTFLVERYKDAVIYLNQVLVFNRSAFNKNETVVAQYLLLLAHYELKNYDLLAYVKLLFRHNESIETLDHLKNKLPLINDRKEEKNVFIEFKKLLLASDKKEFLQTFFDFLSWAESKIQNRPYAEIVKDRSNGSK